MTEGALRVLIAFQLFLQFLQIADNKDAFVAGLIGNLILRHKRIFQEY